MNEAELTELIRLLELARKKSEDVLAADGLDAE
jgi:hypothetical protein